LVNITAETTIRIAIAYITVVGRRNDILKLIPIENVNGDKVALCVTMLPGLGSGDLNNLKQ
jgi:hypothetical protein